MNTRRVIAALPLVLFAGLLLACGAFFWQTLQDYKRLQQVEATARLRLAALEQRLKQQEVVLDRLRRDPEYVERVIRRRLHFAKPDEFVFRFQD